jgi:GrpB-like predicted nucleotidyltransferase (UPF0157 family)
LLAYEHVGSTAVPGLAGKPVVDILAGLETLESAPALAASLKDVGYVQITFRPAGPSPSTDGEPQRLFYLKRTVNTPEGVDLSHPGYNLHVVTLDRFHQDEQLLLRDYLRAHPELIAEYARLKCEIVGRMTTFQEYVPAKSDFIQKLLASARSGR